MRFKRRWRNSLFDTVEHAPPTALAWGRSKSCSDKCWQKAKVTFQLGGLTWNKVPGQRWISACHEARRTILHTKHEDDYPWLNKNTKMLQSTFINSAENWLEVKLRHPFFVSFFVCLFDCFGLSFFLFSVLSFFPRFFLSSVHSFFLFSRCIIRVVQSLSVPALMSLTSLPVHMAAEF